MKDRKEKYGDYEVVESDFDQSQLWVVDVAAAERTRPRPRRAAQITRDPKRSVGEFDWSPDATRIAFAATPEPAARLPVGLRPLPRGARASEGGQDDRRPARARRCDPRFSPDGSELAFETALGEPYHYYANGHIASVRLADVESRPAARPRTCATARRRSTRTRASWTGARTAST